MMPIVGFMKCQSLIHLRQIKIATLYKEHVYVFFCQMPKTKARSGAFQKGADVLRIRRQGYGALHHFETAHSCECIGHYKKRHTHAPSHDLRSSFGIERSIS
jgi:hypothetical protein